MNTCRIINADVLCALRTLEPNSIHCCVTSPPYWGLRDYGIDGQLGLEETPDNYVMSMVRVFQEVRRVLRDDGTLWLNLGDSYATGAGGVGQCPGGGKQGENWKLRGKMTPPNRMPINGLKPKDLVGIPWRVAFALQADGWYLRQDIIWHKPNPMPESVRDRCTKAHEYIFLLTKSERYYYDAESIKDEAKRPNEIGKLGFLKGLEISKNDPNYRTKSQQDSIVTTPEKVNKRSVWTAASQPFTDAHFATFPPKLIEPCILAGSRKGTLVLDPFCGSGTTGMVALRNGRNFLGIELNPEYVEMASRRFNGDAPMFNKVETVVI